MNKAYRVIWNACTNTWTAVQENAKAKGKSSSGRVSAEPATLGSLGLKSSRFVCTALVSALMMTAGYANAAPGIFINDGTDDGCIVTSDESIRRNALFFLVNNNLEWAAGQNGSSMPSVNAFRDKCRPGDAASQTNRALFYGDASGAGSKHLSLGGRLDVNSGIIGLGDRAAGNNSIRIGSGNTLQAANSQSNSVAIGNDVETKAALAVGIGPTAKANGQQSVAVGNSVEASGNFSVAIGTSARANAAQTVALGNNANAAGEDALAIGRSANAQAKDSIAFGRSSQAAAKGVAIGSEASAAVANSVALGSGTTAVAATNQSGTKNVNGLNYTYVGDSANSSVTVGNRQIKQVGAGEVSANSTDAVNGSQLYATQNVIGNIGKGVATNLGGGAALKPDGTFTAPTYNLTDANGNAVSKNNVGDALNVLDSRLNTVGGGFQVAAATGTTQTVKPGNTLKFIDGTNTTTEVSTDGAGVTTVKINATAVALTNNATTGQVNAPTAADANKAATAGSVAAAINTAVGKSGFNVEGGSVAGGAAIGTATSRVNNNDTVKLQAGKNIALVQNGKEFTFGTVEEMEVTSIKAGTAGSDAKLDRDGLTITSTSSVNPVKLTNNGLNNGDNTIRGVAAGAVNASSADAVNGSQLFATNQNVANNAANIAKGINFGGTTGSNNYALGDTINVKGDSNIISETVAGGAQLKLADVLNVGQAAPVKIDGNKGEVSGLSNTTLGGSDFAQGKRAATEEQLNAAQDQLVNVLGGNAANNGGNISMTDIGGTGENNIHDAIKAVNATANLPLTFGGDSGKDVERKPGTKLNIVGGQTDAAKLSDGNIGVVANGSDKLEVKLAKDLAVDSVKAGDTTVNTDGVKVGDVNLTKAGLNNGGNKITNVAAGTDDTDAVNVAQLNKAAAAAKTEVVQGDNIVVTQDVGANGQTIYKVATDKNLKVDSVSAGDTVMNNDGVKVGDDVALNKDGLKAGDVNLTKAGLNNGGNKITNVAAGTADTDAVNVSQLKQAAAASKTEVVQGKNIVVTEKTGDKGQTVYEVATDKDLDVDSVKAGDTTVNNDGVKVGDDVALNKDGLKAGKVNLTKDGLDNAGNKVTNVADGDLNADSKDAVNGSQLYATNQNVANNAATIAKGINFGGTTGSNNYVLGSTINVKGDSNIISETVAGGAQLKLADEISVKTVNADTFKAGDTVMNNDGVKVGDKVSLNKDGLTAGNTVVNNDGVTIAAPTENNPNNQVKLSPVGLNNGGQRITNVAPGKDGTDAANVNQLIGLGTELQNNINQVGKKAYAGVAGAIAQGSIPQVTRPGATGIGVGSGYYGGQSAMAIGVSAMSDGGNWIVKGNFSANTGGHVGVGAGALYQW